MSSFKNKVLNVVAKIPKGRVVSYKEVAKLAGSSKACRAVGNILNKHGGMEKGIPCHRVIRSDGKIGGFASGTKRKTELLKKEGISLTK